MLSFDIEGEKEIGEKLTPMFFLVNIGWSSCGIILKEKRVLSHSFSSHKSS